MQKYALVVASLLGALSLTPAQAQSNVVVYGTVDYGYTYRWDAASDVGSTPNSQSQLNGGQSAANRIGFKGTEDLGNGLKAVFLLEQGFNMDTGTNTTSNGMFNRQAYVGLTGGFGTVVGGTLQTPHYTFVSSLDPFAGGTIGRYSNVYSPVSATEYEFNPYDPVRLNNAVAYVSPSFGGFSVTTAFSNNANGNEKSASNSANDTVYAVLGKYEKGPVAVGLNYHYIAVGSTALVDNIQSATLGGSYDFKVAKLMALYSWTDVNATGLDHKINNYMVGATVPMGKFVGKASYIYSDGSTLIRDAQQLAFGLDYNLSKRTTLYSAYSYVDNKTGRGIGGVTPGNGVSDASNHAYYANSTGTQVGQFQQGLQAGLKHSF